MHPELLRAAHTFKADLIRETLKSTAAYQNKVIEQVNKLSQEDLLALLICNSETHEAADFTIRNIERKIEHEESCPF